VNASVAIALSIVLPMTSGMRGTTRINDCDRGVAGLADAAAC
jgi:hypothetical protein